MTRKIKGKTHILSVLVIAICIGLSVMLAELFSTLLTVNTSVSSSKTDGSFDFYAISLHKTTTKAEANELSSSVCAKGGAGYVWAKDNAYYVLTSAYENQNDAEKVKEKLTSAGTQSEILKISLPAITLSEKYDKNQKTALTNAANVYKNTFKKLYDVSVSLDTSVITEIDAKLKISEINSEVTKAKTDFETIFSSKQTTETIYINVKFKEILEVFDKLANGEKQSELQTYSSQIKYSYLKILNIYQSLSESLK